MPADEEYNGLLMADRTLKSFQNRAGISKVSVLLIFWTDMTKKRSRI
jgi:hypothetical protein